MYLKEAFRHQNILASLAMSAYGFLTTTQNVMHIKEEHLRSKANPDAEDEVLENRERTTPYSANDVIRFLVSLTEEREKLTLAISAAKKSTGIDLDAEVAFNKVRQRTAEWLKGLASLRSSEITSTASGYKFNAEGNQIRYTYDVRRIATIDFDRNYVKKQMEELSGVAECTSTDIDRLMINTPVDYEPLYANTDTFDDAMEKFLARQNR